ncbi:Asp-tRNA(Asn)/Glu-tRNA(Gln) amidotransferase A subunit family amidase [Paraburkholderia unamae]|uniref:amidase n=1 Tax=Paraburkholderia unamae TaxID=219649 RepID=UPI000DC2CEBA|nr:amidase [Paraburkholderia unamae]RAR54243.1 Asp-tRNA(Asn)/Glu-tRNA(Gln) amidotransferase A subunit family amidase [Paraburkholderia unamae]
MNTYHDAAPLTALAIRHGLVQGHLTHDDVLDRIDARIASCESHVKAWVAFDTSTARTDLSKGNTSTTGDALLAGVPIGVKDIFTTRDFPTHYGSPIYAHGVVADDAACVALARAAGALVIGKTVTTEFAYFQPGPSANPHDVRRTPGGSSSGSAAAVAAGMTPLAFGSQTAGSLIRPASYCGVFALKPTYDACSLNGAKAMSPSLDTLGWLARSADDLELLRAALTLERFDALPELENRALRIAILPGYEQEPIEAAAHDVLDSALVRLSRAGVSIISLDVPNDMHVLVDAQKTVQAYEAARSFKSEWRTKRDLLSAPFARLIGDGLATTGTAYDTARELAARSRNAFAALTREVDAVLTLAAPGEAPIGLEATGDPVLSRSWTLLGLPCVNVPGLHGPNGLPLGLQVIGKPKQERRLLAIAKRLNCLIEQGN